MDDDQIGSLRDFLSAAYHYLTAPKSEAPARRVELCEAVGALLFALEGPLPDDDPDGNDVEPAEKEAELPPRPCIVTPLREGATVIPLYGVRPRRSRRPTRDHR